MNKLTKTITKREGLILVFVVLILLRLPSLFEPSWYGDENIYLTIGQGIRKGLVLYKGITDFPNKPPLIYMLAAGVKTVFWFRFLLLFWNGLHAFIVFLLGKEIWPTKVKLWYFFTIGFMLLTSLPILEGNIANGEIFMTMPVTAGFLSLVRAVKQNLKWKNYLVSGTLFGIGLMFKIPVVADIAAAVVIFWVMRKGFSFKNLYMFGTGVFIPALIAIVFHWWQGVGLRSLLGNAVGSSGYVSVWQKQEGLKALLTMATLPARATFLTLITLVLIVFRKRLSFNAKLATGWLVFSLFGALLSARPYPHYLIQLVVPFLMAMVVATVDKKKVSRIVVALGLIITVAAVIRFDFRTYPVAAYYQNFAEYVLGKKNTTSFYQGFDWRMERNYRLAEYIKTHTDVKDKIYIWGTQPGIYVLADRLPVGRLTTSFHVEDLNEYKNLAKQIDMKEPKYIIYMTDEPRSFKLLDEIIAQKYMMVDKFGEALIYRLEPLFSKMRE